MPSRPRSFTKDIRDKRKPKHNWGDDKLRGNRHERGYGNDWVKVRDAHIVENPLCKHCKERGYLTAATDVDHIIPFTSLDDPKRLDRNNLQSLCKDCHNKKTSSSRKG